MKIEEINDDGGFIPAGKILPIEDVLGAIKDVPDLKISDIRIESKIWRGSSVWVDRLDLDISKEPQSPSVFEENGIKLYHSMLYIKHELGDSDFMTASIGGKHVRIRLHLQWSRSKDEIIFEGKGYLVRSLPEAIPAEEITIQRLYQNFKNKQTFELTGVKLTTE